MIKSRTTNVKSIKNKEKIMTLTMRKTIITGVIMTIILIIMRC